MASLSYVAVVKSALLLELPAEAEELCLMPGDRVSIQIERDIEPDSEPYVNESMLAALKEIAERQKGRRYTDGSDTVAMLREARDGAMWRREPSE